MRHQFFHLYNKCIQQYKLMSFWYLHVELFQILANFQTRYKVGIWVFTHIFGMNVQIQGFQEPLFLQLISAVVLFHVLKPFQEFAEPW